jgi:5-methylcytosine-specific restriction endonuclease McrA
MIQLDKERRDRIAAAKAEIASASRPTKRVTWYELRFVEDETKVHVTCNVCLRSMWLPQSKVGMYRRCGPRCTAAARAEEREARRRNCETCGASFIPRPRQIRLGQGRFCRQACNSAAQEALNSPEAKALAKQITGAMSAAGLIRRPRGPESASWKGGYEAQRARLRDSGKSAARLRAYRKRNPHKSRESSRRRLGRKLGRLPWGTIPRIGEAQGWRCAICRINLKHGYHMDHVVPLARGGLHEARNIQLLCRTCNVRKNAKDPIDYMQSLGRLL